MFAKCAAAVAACLIAVLIHTQASSACLTQAEARQMFRTSHLYWHGKDHCWDASGVATRPPSPAQPVRRQESRASSAVTAKVQHETATIGLSSSPANSDQLQQATVLPEVRHWSDTMAMAETIETTPWIDRWPNQPIKPPTRPIVAEAAADAALVNPRGMVAGITALILSLALWEILFGGTNLRRRFMFGFPAQFPVRRSRRLVPKSDQSFEASAAADSGRSHATKAQLTPVRAIIRKSVGRGYS
jgi:hypothetical protein